MQGSAWLNTHNSSQWVSQSVNSIEMFDFSSTLCDELRGVVAASWHLVSTSYPLLSGPDDISDQVKCYPNGHPRMSVAW